MAERYGGRFSPQGSPQNAPQPPDNPFRGRMPARAGLKANLLFILPLPLAVRAFLQDAGGLVATVIGLALMLLAAWLTRDGERAQQEYDSRTVARRPAFPRKIAAALAMGAGVAAATWPGAGPVGGAALGLLAAALHVTAFGPDPLHDKGMEGIDPHNQDRAARAVEQAEAYLAAMNDAILRAGDRQLERRVETFQASARRMFRAVEEDPRDLAAARRYLTVYLMGARDATVKFADIYARSRDPKARAGYESLLTDLQAGFDRQTESLLGDNRDDLEIEIDVLRERLEREGIRTG